MPYRTLIAAMVLTPLLLGWGGVQLGGGVPVAAGGGNTMYDTFERTTDPNNDVDGDTTGQSGTLATWAISELNEAGTCELLISSGDARMLVNGPGNSQCDYQSGLLRLDDALTVDQWIAVKRGQEFSWDQGGYGGWGAAVRLHSDSDGGRHYQFSCNGGVLCTSVGVGMGIGPSFQLGISANALCDSSEGWTTIAVNDWVGFSVEGTGESTVWKMWDFQSASDPGDYDTWGTATCTITSSPNGGCTGSGTPAACCSGSNAGTCEDDDGTFIGPRWYTSQANLGDYFGFEAMKAGDI